MKQNSVLTQELEQLLAKECSLYERYGELLKAEHQWITRFDAEKLNAITLRRAELQDELCSLAAHTKKFPAGVALHFPPQRRRSGASAERRIRVSRG